MVKGSAPETNKIDQVVISYSSHKDTPSFRRLIIEIVDFVLLYFNYISLDQLFLSPSNHTEIPKKEQ
jgi:hypothetical protein